MTETQIWGSGYRTGVKLARAVRLHGGRRRAGRSRQEIIPAGAHIETFCGSGAVGRAVPRLGEDVALAEGRKMKTTLDLQLRQPCRHSTQDWRGPSTSRKQSCASKPGSPSVP
jgi:hypothetical protein